MNKKILISLMAAGSLLRIIGIWILPLWYDETFSYLLAKLPLSGLIAATMGDVHPPLHYLTIWPLIQLGLPDWAIRIPSLIFSLLSLWIFYRILLDLEYDYGLIGWAMLLMVVNPVQLYYAQEGRMYALLELAVLLAVLCNLERRWILLGLAIAAMLYTDNYGIFYAGCILISGLVYWRGERWKSILLAVGTGSLLYLPWIPTLISQTILFRGHHWIPPVTLGGLFYNLQEILMIHTMNWKALVLNELMIFGLLTFGICWLFKNRIGSYRYFLLVMAFGPALIAFIFSLAIEPVLLFRCLIGSSPFLLLTMIQPISWYSDNRIRSLSMGIIILPLLIVNLISFISHISTDSSNRSFTEAFNIIRSDWKSGDIIYNTGDESWLFSIASSLITQSANYLKPNCGDVLGGLSDLTHKTLGADIIPISDLNYSRAWILSVKSPLHPECDFIQNDKIIGNTSPLKCWEDVNYYQFCMYLVEDK